MINKHVIFVINLLQDINVLRPLVYMAATDLKLPTLLLITSAFKKRDKTGIWQEELNQIVSANNAKAYDFSNELEALQLLQNLSGVIIAGSESHLNAHKPVHDLFRIAPACFIKITLQHGFECVGFLQSRDQNIAHGTGITFAADIICGWCEPERLTALTASQRHKLVVTGPTAVLQQPTTKVLIGRRKKGLICENMHSPRLNIAGDFKTDFLDIFSQFCVELQKQGRSVALRPHPGGQYTIKNDVPIPANVEVVNIPIYKVDLSQYAYGISAPSSILIDMVLAGIPTAVWQDQGSVMDLGNYEGLTRISCLEDWLDFVKDALIRPEIYIERQKLFFARQKLCITQEVVYQAYANLLTASVSIQTGKALRNCNKPTERILFIAPGFIPTLQLSFLKPLAGLAASGHIIIDIISEIHLNAEFKAAKAIGDKAREWLQQRIEAFAPNVVIFCRYAGPHTRWMTDYFSHKGITMIYHLDDDLLAVPKEIDAKKWAHHNQPERLAAVKHLLSYVNLVYCSTSALKNHLSSLRLNDSLYAGKIYCSASVIIPAKLRSVKKVGYMGIGHESDLTSILPALVSYLQKNTEIIFEIFGTIPIPKELEEFGDRIRGMPKIENYAEFLQQFAKYDWDIGICPLTSIPFNKLKANTKWVEYTAVGVAVIASRGTVYDECCADGCGILADNEHEWFNALECLTHDADLRLAQVACAQQKLKQEYSVEQLRDQVLEIIAKAKDAPHIDIQANLKIPALPVYETQQRILFISNAYVPTLQLSFVKPLTALVESDDINMAFFSEQQIKQNLWKNLGFVSVEDWVKDIFFSFRPMLVIFCRYSGPYANLLLELVSVRQILTIYHIDDDLLGIPKEIGNSKYKYHNQKNRLDTVRLLLNSVNLVYASTEKLKYQLNSLSLETPIINGSIYCSGQVINPAQLRPVVKIGYMASADHAHNLTLVIPAIVRLMRKNNEIVFEFFGSIPSPPEFAEFGGRILHAQKINNYEEFLQCFAKYQWDIGICPLSPIHFNMMKANTKWVEYTSVGAAVVASKGTVYDGCCADGCGILASTENEWFEALEMLTRDPVARYEQVKHAQEKLIQYYSIDRLREQVIDVFSQANRLHVETKLKTIIECTNV